MQSRCEILSDLPERVDFIDTLPDYEPELYIHKKSKTNLENSLETLEVLLPICRRRRIGATRRSMKSWSRSRLIVA